MRKCAVIGCENKYYAKGFCNTHWAANRRYGSPFGKHPEKAQEMQDIAVSAVRLARKIVAWDNSTDVCQFCHNPVASHAPDCIRIIATNILLCLD